MRPKRIASWLLAIAGAASLAHGGQTISVDFQGRDGTNNDPEPPLAATAVAGVLPVANWNSVDNFNGFTPNNVGTTPVLNDSTGAATAVTLSFAGNDSWYNDTDLTVNTSPNALMMAGIIKTGKNGTATFTFNHLAEGLYDVYVYTTMNGDGVAIKIGDWDGVTTYYTQEAHKFLDTSSFVQAVNTDPGAIPDQGNYVKLSGLNTSGRGAVGVVSTHLSGADGQGIAGIQIVNVGGPVVNTIPLQLNGQTGNRRVAVGDTTVSVSATLQGPPSFQQWYKNGTAITGANGSSYTLPAIAQSDDQASLVFVATNNVNSVTSAPIVLTVGKRIKLPGFALVQRWNGHKALADLDGGSLDGVTPDFTTASGSFDGELNNGINDFVERVSGLFVPPTTGNYLFYVCSDDDSTLWLSTDEKPANKSQIATETGWNNNHQWLTSAGGSDVTQKVSGAMPLVAGKSYYIEANLHQGGGGENVSATFALDTDPVIVDGSASRITGSALGAYVDVLDGAVITPTAVPTNTTIVAGHAASFGFAVATSIKGDTVLPLPQINYQWQAAPTGSTTFTNIAGATGANLNSPTANTYTTGFLPASASGTQYRVQISANDASWTSPAAVVTVIADTNAPVILSASGISRVDNTAATDGTASFAGSAAAVEIGLIVDKPLDTTASLALANFKLNSGTVTAARFVSDSSGTASLERGIVLSTTGLTPGSSYTLTVSGLKDLNGNVSSAVTVPVKVSKLTWSGLGIQDPLYPNDVVAVSDNGFDVNSGGNGFWNQDDDVTYIYETASGDFDKVVQVAYQDASSNWARAGLMVRESLDADGTTLASRYQAVHADPAPVKFDGTPSNNAYETNRRLHTGDATTSSNAGGNPKYPGVWVRLRRIGDVIHMYRSDDGNTWTQLGFTDFNPADGTGSPLPANLIVGIVYGAENGNIGDTTKRQSWAAQFRNYGNYVSPVAARGSQTYSIGVHFTDSSVGSFLAATDVAGVPAVAQGNWNNSPPVAVSDSPITVVGEKNGAKVTTSVTVDWSGSPNTWASTGRGEENDNLAGADHLLFQGYIDTGSPTTTSVHVKGLPSDLTTGKYDLLVYANGGVPTRGGGYRVLGADGITVLKDYVAYQVPAGLTNYVQVPPAAAGVWSSGNYIVFTGLSSPEVTIEATTDNNLGFGGTPRAPLNAVQFVTPSGLLNPLVNPTLSYTWSAGTLTLTYKGTLQSAATPDGPYTNVSGASSPYTVDTSVASQKFYRTHQ